MSSPSFSVKDLHVLISGGCGGIGSAFAKAFIAHGATVTVTDLQPPSESLSALGVAYHELDVTNDEAVEALAKKRIHCQH